MRHDGSPKLALVTEDCFAALVRAFMLSPKWTQPPPDGYADATKQLWRHELSRAARPDCLGPVSLQKMRPALVQAYLDGLAGRPGKQAAAKAALAQLDKWASVRDLLPRSIMLGVETGRPKGGHAPWTEQQIATALPHVGPDVARAIVLAANTGQRVSDLIRMGWTDIEMHHSAKGSREGICVVQKKTKREVWVPITVTLRAAMAGWERRPGPFLTHNGKTWNGPKAITHAWQYRRDTVPGLAEHKAAGLVLHGLRATACVFLKREGASDLEIGDTVGMSAKMVERYCRFSKQRDNALATIIRLETIRERDGSKGEKTGS